MEKSQLIENQNEKTSYTARVFADLLKFAGKNARQFAIETGISEEQISKYLNGKRQSVSPKVADKVLEFYPDISRSWLLSGIGNMLQNVNVEGHGNGNGNTVTVGIDGDKLLAILQAREDDVRSRNSQIDRLLTIIERMQQ